MAKRAPEGFLLSKGVRTGVDRQQLVMRECAGIKVSLAEWRPESSFIKIYSNSIILYKHHTKAVE